MMIILAYIAGTVAVFVACWLPLLQGWITNVYAVTLLSIISGCPFALALPFIADRLRHGHWVWHDPQTGKKPKGTSIIPGRISLMPEDVPISLLITYTNDDLILLEFFRSEQHLLRIELTRERACDWAEKIRSLATGGERQ